MVVERCNRQFGCETIHPTEKFNFNEFVANVLRDNMGMIIYDFWGCGGCQRPKTSYLGCTLWRFNSTLGSSLSTSSAYQRFTTKWNQFQLPFSLHFLNSRMKLYLVHDNSRSASYKLFYPALSFTLNFKII